MKRANKPIVVPPLGEAALALLVCPVCHAPLTTAEQEIACTGCGRRYPVRDGLPVLLAAAALT